MIALELRLPGLPKSPNVLLRRHWSFVSREKSKWHKLVASQIDYETHKHLGGEPLKKARLTLTRHSAREPDSDNLIASFKFVVDALVKCGVLLDDKPSVIGIPTYKWEKASPKNGHITVLIDIEEVEG